MEFRYPVEIGQNSFVGLNSGFLTISVAIVVQHGTNIVAPEATKERLKGRD